MRSLKAAVCIFNGIVSYLKGKERTVIEKSNYFAPNTPLIGRRVGQTVKLKCRSRRYKLLRPFEKKNLMFSWSKDGKVRHLPRLTYFELG